MTSFKIELLIIDNAGYQFIDSANESELFRDAKMNLKFFDFNSDKTGNDYQQMLMKAKSQYNVKENVICLYFLFLIYKSQHLSKKAKRVYSDTYM